MHLSIDGKPPEAQAKKTLHAAMDGGVTFIDTADVYCIDDGDIGANERLIASVLAERNDRDSIRVATKGGLRRPKGDWTRDGSPRHLREACEQSLRSLGVDRIFLYQLHAPDPAVPLEASIETLGELQRSGKIEHIGVSNVTVEQIRVCQDLVDVVTVQNRLNPFFREAIESGVLRACEEQKITFIAYSPVGGGRLSRRVGEIPAVAEIAKKRGCSPHAVILAWVRAQSERVLPIPSARTPEHASDSAASAELALTASEVSAIDEAEFSRA
jgi:aryl-alcohol dehydrogenase-like predicted oxidoreductase